MAQSVGTVLAKNMKMFFGATAITCQVDASISGSTNMFETTCKDSAANASFLPGSKSWTASVTGNYAEDATVGFPTPSTGIFALWDTQESVAIVFQTGDVGNTKFSGSAYISSISVEASGNDNAVTFTAELQGTGALVRSIIA